MRKLIAISLLVLIVGVAAPAVLAVGLARFSRLSGWDYQQPEPWDDMGPPPPTGTLYTIKWKSRVRGVGVEYECGLREGHEAGFCMWTASWPVLHCRSGWPWKMLRSESELCSRVWLDGLVVQSLPLPGDGERKAVPIRIVWSGLAANAAMFTLLPLVLWRGCVIGCRQVRLAQGRCEACGYDARGLWRCPECGKALELGRATL